MSGTRRTGKQSIEPETGHIPAEDWATIVRNVPIPAVDLVVLHDGGVILGKRRNKPAKGEWFVLGGRIRGLHPLNPTPS